MNIRTRLIALLLVIATMLSLMGSAVPAASAVENTASEVVSVAGEATEPTNGGVENAATPFDEAGCGNELCSCDPCTCEVCECDDTIWTSVMDAEDLTATIGYLDQSVESIRFFDDLSGETILSPAECPAYLMLTVMHTDADGNALIYEVDSYDSAFKDTVVDYHYYVEASAFSAVAPIAGTYATISPDAGEIFLYADLTVATDVKRTTADKLSGEYVVADCVYAESIYGENNGAWFIKLTPDAAWPVATNYVWLPLSVVAALSPTPTQVPDEPDVPVCDICGKTDCDGTKIHFYCELCDEYDCGESHVYCAVCGQLNCQQQHNFCSICNDYDCGIQHANPYAPVTAPELPENPVLTPDEDVSLVDREGNPVTDAGITLLSGTRISLSAWGNNNAAGASYQWQVCYDQINDLWVDIWGEDEQGILISEAMLAAVADDNNVALLRCEMTVGEQSFYSCAVPVTLGGTVSKGAFASGSNGIATAGAAGDTDVKERHSVTIRYIYEDGSIAAATWAANLAEGDEYQYTFNMPSVVGYKPSVTQADMDAVTAGMFILDNANGTITVNIQGDALQKDETLTVTYVPDYVKVTIRHLFQDVVGFDYDDTEPFVEEIYDYVTGEVIDGTPAKNGPAEKGQLHKNYPGFRNLLYSETETAAADGSKVIEIYYDRYYYLINFDLENGYGVEPIYARYGTPIEVDTSELRRPGYTFGGWLDENGDPADLPATMPVTSSEETGKEYLTFKANWIINPSANVSVVVWGQNANDDEYTYMAEESFTVEAVPGSTLTWDSVRYSCGMTEHSHSTACFGCGQAEHAHIPSCYTTTGGKLKDTAETNSGWLTRLNSATANAKGIYTVSSGGTRYYIKLNGSYYQITLNGNTKINNFSYSLKCTTPVHSHNDSCYVCGKTAHTHTNACNRGDVVDTDLWQYEKSETITVNPDGTSVLNVYFTRREFTITFKNSYGSTITTITERWGADISKYWPVRGDDGTVYDDGQRWSPSGSSIYNAVLVYIAIMPEESFTLTLNTSNYDTFIMHYMVEALVSEQNDPDVVTYQGKKFKEDFVVSANYNHITDAEDFFPLAGFTKWTSNPQFSNGKLDINGGGDVYFYYTRNSYPLVFNNGVENVELEGIPSMVPYQTPLSEYADHESPPVPDIYPEGSVVFDGWYLNPECTEPYDLNTHTMPEGGLILYAKWTPVIRTIRFFLDKEMMELGDGYTIPETLGNNDPENPYSIKFANRYELNNTKIGYPFDPGVSGDHGGEPHKYWTVQFLGWFYIENGEEKGFDPEFMHITRDLDLYAKWTSDKLCPIEVYYVLANAAGEKLDANGNVTENSAEYVHVAASENTTALIYSDKTFAAKTGSALYEAYREGYYPNTASTSINVRDLNSDGTNPNVYYFTYTQKEKVPYEVRYVVLDENKNEIPLILDENGTLRLPTDDDTAPPYVKYVGDNTSAVVTEDFIFISGYLPDASQKRLVLSSSEAENVITFYYTANIDKAMYRINHYIQSADGTGWVQRATNDGVIDMIGERVEIAPMEVSGYFFAADVTDYYNITLGKNGYTNEDLIYDGIDPFGSEVPGMLTAILPEEGMELNLYYVRPTQLTLKKDVNVQDGPLTGFEFTISFPDGVELETAYEYSSNQVTNPDPAQVNTENRTMTVTLSRGETIIFKDLPLGAYTITEADYSTQGYTTKVAVDEENYETRSYANINLAYGIPVSVTYLNEYPMGNLKIIKRVEPECGEDIWEGGTFTFVITRKALPNGEPAAFDNSMSYKVVYKNNETNVPVIENKLTVTMKIEGEDVDKFNEKGFVECELEIRGLIAATYQITEQDVNGYTCSQKSMDVNIPEQGTVKFTNILNRYRGDLQISKTVNVEDGANEQPGAADIPFEFEIHLNTAYADKGPFTARFYGIDDDPNNAVEVREFERLVPVDNTLTVSLIRGQKVIIEDLPACGYTVEETHVDGYLADYAGTDEGDIPNNGVAVVGCVNHYPYYIADIQIHKTVKMEDVVEWSGDTFRFAVTPVGQLAQGADLTGKTFTVENGDEASVSVNSNNELVVTMTFSAEDAENLLTNKEVEKTLTIKSVPTGTYTVTEAASDIYTQSATEITKVVNKPTTVFAFVNTIKPQKSTLTINVRGDKYDENDSFIFTVTNSDGFNQRVIINGGSVTLFDVPIGEYTVTPDLNWSNRYTILPEEATVEVDAAGGVVNFDTSVVNNKWLSGSDYARNLFTGKTQ